MNYDYNKPHFWKSKNRYLDNTKVFAEYWWLKDMMQPAAVWAHDKNRFGGYYGDFKKGTKDVLIVATELQNYNLFCEMFDKHGWQVKDHFEADLENKHLELYKQNNNNPLIINY